MYPMMRSDVGCWSNTLASASAMMTESSSASKYCPVFRRQSFGLLELLQFYMLSWRLLQSEGSPEPWVMGRASEKWPNESHAPRQPCLQGSLLTSFEPSDFPAWRKRCNS